VDVAYKHQAQNASTDQTAREASAKQALDETSRKAVLKLLAKGRYHEIGDVFRGVPGRKPLAYQAAVVFLAKQREEFSLQAQTQRGMTPSINESGQHVVDAVIHHHKTMLQLAKSEHGAMAAEHAEESQDTPKEKAQRLKSSWKEFADAYDAFAVHLMKSTWGQKSGETFAEYYRRLCASPQKLSRAYWGVVEREGLGEYLDKVELPLPKAFGYSGPRPHIRA
jgi:hypothetical protein